MRKIAVIGMGYVGIPAAALFADVDGFDVTGIQRRSNRSGWKIDYLNDGRNPIKGHEPGLADLIHRVVKGKRSFRVVDDYSVCGEMDAILIDVQTPTDEHRIPRYESLREVSAYVGEYMRAGTLVVIESTCAPGTTDYIAKLILEKESGMKAGKDFYLAFSYERVMVGRLIHNIVNYPRIVGGINKESTEKAIELYSHIVKAELFPTTALTAEVSKTVENAYRDVNIAFANEVGLVCESLGVNVYDVRKFVNSLPNDPSNPAANPVRNMHFPGAGVGGHCLPKDSWLLKYGVDTYGKKKVETPILVKSRETNDHMPQHMKELIQEAFNEKELAVKNKKIALLGFAFLENSDDTRNTPAIPLYEKLKELGANVMIHDSFVQEYENLPIEHDLDAVLAGADCVALVTAHEEYSKLGADYLAGKMRTKILIDGRNVFSEKRGEFEKVGFFYRCVGIGVEN